MSVCDNHGNLGPLVSQIIGQLTNLPSSVCPLYPSHDEPMTRLVCRLCIGQGAISAALTSYILFPLPTFNATQRNDEAISRFWTHTDVLSQIKKTTSNFYVYDMYSRCCCFLVKDNIDFHCTWRPPRSLRLSTLKPVYPFTYILLSISTFSKKTWWCFIRPLSFVRQWAEKVVLTSEFDNGKQVSRTELKTNYGPARPLCQNLLLKSINS